jgi:putative redox protein
MDLLLEALGGCSAIDIVVIMQKVRTPLNRFEMSIEAVRNETDPKFYTAAGDAVRCLGRGYQPRQAKPGN